MELLKQRIINDGRVLSGNILKVDSFLNHQIDPDLMMEIGKEFHRLFENEGITKVVTIEASGIPPALAAAYEFRVPCVFAKKTGSHNIGGDVYTSKVHSYTYDRDYTIALSRPYLSCTDKVLLIDDFLANGAAMEGLLNIVNQAGAMTAGIGIVIEKGFQPGGQNLRKLGVNLQSLAIIKEMKDNGEIIFE